MQHLRNVKKIKKEINRFANLYCLFFYFVYPCYKSSAHHRDSSFFPVGEAVSNTADIRLFDFAVRSER